jgi:transcriptional regulator with XRE-family HTH domain
MLQSKPRERTNRPHRSWKYLPALKHIREDQGLSIRELAALAGVTPDTVWRIEREYRAAQPETRRRIAKALGVRSRNLVKRPLEEEVDEM